MEKTLKEHGDSVGSDEKQKIEEAKTALEKAKDGDDPEAIKAAIEELNTAAHKLSEEMYKKVAEAQAQQKQAAAGAAPGADAADGAGATEGGDDDVIDADYEVKE
jgi:molecular chaperone DnaK